MPSAYGAVVWSVTPSSFEAALWAVTVAGLVLGGRLSSMDTDGCSPLPSLASAQSAESKYLCSCRVGGAWKRMAQ